MVISRTAMDKLKKKWKNRNISKPTKIGLVRSFIYPIFLYAVKMWTLREIVMVKKSDWSIVDSFLQTSPLYSKTLASNSVYLFWYKLAS